MGCINCGDNDCKDSCTRIVITKQGEKGPAGNPGIQGERGLTGNQGIQGANGANGTNGSDAVLPYDALYTGLISQTGVLAPTIGIPTTGNTLGAVVWTYQAPGVYVGTLAGAFTNGVICTLTQGSWTFRDPAFLQCSRLTDDTVQIRVFDGATGVLTDGLLANANLKIERYPA